MISYWEQVAFLSYDYIIIGAGICGMSTAIELRAARPDSRILILERGYMTTGASSRNAGFACMGSVTELLDDLALMPEAEVVQLYADRKKGLALLRKRLGDDRIGYRAEGSYELLDAQALPALDRIDYLNALLAPVTGQAAFRLAPEQIGPSGFDPGFTQAMIENTCEGSLHTGYLLRALTDLCLSLRIEIKTGTSVSHFEASTDGVSVLIPDPLRGSDWQLNCRKLVVCTNAFSRQFFPEEIIQPGRGQVLITQPVPGLRFKGIYHFHHGYYYFRELEGRVLFGGGRHLDFSGETTTELTLNERIQDSLDHFLSTVILPGIPYTVDRRWSGIMAFGPTRQPIVKAFSSQVFGAFRMGGMGVALGSLAAAKVAGLLLETEA